MYMYMYMYEAALLIFSSLSSCMRQPYTPARSTAHSYALKYRCEGQSVMGAREPLY